MDAFEREFGEEALIDSVARYFEALVGYYLDPPKELCINQWVVL